MERQPGLRLIHGRFMPARAHGRRDATPARLNPPPRVSAARSLRLAIGQEAGQSMIELALLLPMLVFMLVGGADLARAYAAQIAVQNGARAGAESYAINSTPTVNLAKAAAVAEMNRTPSVFATINNVDVRERQADGITPCVHPPTPATPCWVTVEVTYIWNTVTPWPLIPNQANFDRVTIFRMFY